MKKLICLITVMIFSLNISVFAADANILKLNEALESGIKNSKKLKISEMNITTAEAAYDQAVDDSEALNMSVEEDTKWYNGIKDRAGITAKRKEYELTPEQKEYEMKLSVKTKDLDKDTLVLDIISTYYSLLKTNKDVELKNQEYNLANKSLVKVTEKYKKGLISKNDYKLAQLSKKDSLVKLNTAKRAQKKMITKLYNLMGQGYSPDIKTLEENLSYTDMKNVKVEDMISKALENRIEMYKVKNELELKELEFEIIDKYYDEDHVQYKEAMNNLEEAKLNIETKKQDIEYEIRIEHNNLLNLLDTIEISKKEVEKNKINYDTLLLKGKLGMLIDTEVEQGKLNLDKANVDLNNSIIDYIVAKYKFDAACGIGPALN